MNTSNGRVSAGNTQAAFTDLSFTCRVLCFDVLRFYVILSSQRLFEGGVIITYTLQKKSRGKRKLSEMTEWGHTRRKARSQEMN